jgi:CubicO group peptidase (beta-lactamase class C family)
MAVAATLVALAAPAPGRVCAARQAADARSETRPNRMAPRDVDAAVVGAAEAFMRSGRAVGLSIGVAKGGTARTYHFGETAPGSGRRPTDETRYALASVTKTFTGTLLAQAAVEKRVRLEDDVRLYLDGRYPNLEFQGRPVRLVDLLNHTSGLPRSLQPVDGPAPGGPAPGREAFYAALRRVTLEREPGKTMSYSNAGVQLLGYVLERIYGRPFEELVKKRIAATLGLRSVTVSLSARERAGFRGYDADGREVAGEAGETEAAGALKATVRDLLTYARWHLRERDAAVRLTHRPTWSNGSIYAAGLAWQMFTMPRYRMIWQEGSLPGFSAFCVFFPELDLAVVALANEFDPDTSDRMTAMVKSIAKALDPRAADLP